MKLTELDTALRGHRGEFLCERRDNHEKKTKLVSFCHVVILPDMQTDVPVVGRLKEFYETFGSILFYHDKKSGDAAKYLAHPTEWAGLHISFSNWLEDVTEDERRDFVPDWIETCLVIGETPRSGNYILVPIKGPKAGHIFEFDHDGYEFTEKAHDVVEYVETFLSPDCSTLAGIASHMRFIEEDPMMQWVIREMRDNGGRIVRIEN